MLPETSRAIPTTEMFPETPQVIATVYCYDGFRDRDWEIIADWCGDFNSSQVVIS